jgi:hypothetical protein
VSDGGLSDGGVSAGRLSDGASWEGGGFGPREAAPDEGLGGTFMSQTTP